MEKGHVKISAQSKLRISGNLRNREEGHIWETRNKREHKGRSKLGGAPAPLQPWRPWTRGGTLLPSRGEAKEEEEGGARIMMAIYINNLATVNTNFLPIYAAV